MRLRTRTRRGVGPDIEAEPRVAPTAYGPRSNARACMRLRCKLRKAARTRKRDVPRRAPTSVTNR
jgi:hypothetical protein